MLNGRVFDPDISMMSGMAELIEIVEFQGWSHPFVPPAYLGDKEVGDFYGDLMITQNKDAVCASVNGVNFTLDEALLGKILGVPTEGIATVVGQRASDKFLSIIRKHTRN